MPALSPLDAMRLTLELFDLGLALHRQTLRRRYPDETEAQIERRLNAWLSTRPGAEHGDAQGRPRPIERGTP